MIAMAEVTGVSMEWLATGDGPMMKADLRPAPKSAEEDDFIYVDQMVIEASAGHGAENGEENVKSRMAFRRDWLREKGLDYKRLSVIRARGDSMEPSIFNGENILVETYFRKEKDGHRQSYVLGLAELIPRDGIYVVRLDNHLSVKRLQLDMKGGIYIKSDNPAYETLHITKDQMNDITVVGRVVWVGRVL